MYRYNRKDYLEREIEKLGQVFGAFVSRYLGAKFGQIQQFPNQEDISWVGEVNVPEIEKILSHSPETLLHNLVAEAYSFEAMEAFADLLLLLEQHLASLSFPQRMLLKDQALVIYQYVLKDDEVFSFGLKQKIDQLLA